MFDIETLEGGSGQPLVYLHGIEQPGWSPLLEDLARDHRVLAPRMPGFGESSGDEQLLDLHDLLYFYLDLLDEQGLRNLPLVGHAIGGMIAAELAAMQPERFSKLVLIAPLGLWNNAYPVYDYFVETPDDVAARAYADPNSELAQAARTVPEDLDGRIAFQLERLKSLRVAAKYTWPIPDRGLDKRLHRVKPPTLLVWGEKDGINPPQYAADFQRALPNAIVERIAGAGHVPHVEQPEAVLARVRAFLGR
jgi:pimeloyl-ACP methyl ester carboxylesterase